MLLIGSSVPRDPRWRRRGAARPDHRLEVRPFRVSGGRARAEMCSIRATSSTGLRASCSASSRSRTRCGFSRPLHGRRGSSPSAPAQKRPTARNALSWRIGASSESRLDVERGERAIEAGRAGEHVDVLARMRRRRIGARSTRANRSLRSDHPRSDACTSISINSRIRGRWVGAQRALDKRDAAQALVPPSLSADHAPGGNQQSGAARRAGWRRRACRDRGTSTCQAQRA